MFTVNTYVQIIGVLLATLWASGMRWYDNEQPHLDGGVLSNNTHSRSRTVVGSSMTDSAAHKSYTETIHIYDLRVRDDIDSNINEAVELRA